MKSIDLADAVLARLASATPAAMSAHDGRPEKTPTGLYCYLTDDPGLAGGTRLDGTEADLAWTINVVAVGPTAPGARLAASFVRDALTGWRPDPHRSAGPLTELSVGPLLTDGPEGDLRHSQTIIYRHHGSRS
ncbi:hypothetical protein ACQCX2_07805 [Propionibacteriaceae bacterium Y1700]|uniref:hypothetical protein n=1 Tax=Microlunatus sp. Y1700 TaxID=3418487 RepID=UPI003DA77ECF